MPLFLLRQAFFENKLIQIFDCEFNYKKSVFNPAYHFKFPYKNRPKKIYTNYITEYDLKKALTKQDHLIVLSNYSLSVYHFNKNHELMGKFLINNEIFKDDFQNRLKIAKAEGGGIFPFDLFLDNKENICVAYMNSKIENFEIYKYTVYGELLGIYRTHGEISPPFCCDSQGNIYSAFNHRSAIAKYKINY